MSEIFKKNKFGLKMIGFLMIIFLPLYIYVKIKFNKIDNEGLKTIGRYVQIKKLPKSRRYYFKYYKSNTFIKTLVSPPPDEYIKKIGGFFEIKYLESYDEITVNYEKEIIDTFAIIKAGFSKEEIEYFEPEKD